MRSDEQYLKRFEYTQARNLVRKLLRRDKRTFEKNIAHKAKYNPKLFWSLKLRFPILEAVGVC